MKQKFKTIILFIGLYLVLTSGNGQAWTWPVIGPAAPFKTDKPSVLIVEETSQRTPQLDAIFNAIEKATVAAGGQYRLLDKDQSDLSQDAQWAQDAWKVKGASVPWIVAAGSRGGVNAALVTTSAADAIKQLAPIGVK